MPKRVLKGQVVTKTDKTISVLVNRIVKHPLYHKTMTKSKKFAAHDENNECVVGDTVEIIESKPISKTKTWLLKSIKKGN
ncbi:MAG: 30S ribosomal protein S17 [Pseudomonadota bacterium]